MPRYSERKGWTGGDSRTLYAFRDQRNGSVRVAPGGMMTGIGPVNDVSVATRSEAEKHWQDPLHKGWKVACKSGSDDLGRTRRRSR